MFHCLLSWWDSGQLTSDCTKEKFTIRIFEHRAAGQQPSFTLDVQLAKYASSFQTGPLARLTNDDTVRPVHRKSYGMSDAGA
jgi:hypothetical protein